MGLLRRSLYGTRSAAKNWQLQLGRDITGLGFRQAASSPCLFWHAELDARLVVHGDDVWVLADSVSLAALLPRLHQTYELRANGILGPDGCDDVDEDCDGRTDEDCVPGGPDAGDAGIADADLDAGDAGDGEVGDGDVGDGDLDADATDVGDGEVSDGPAFDSGGRFGPGYDGEFPELGPCPQPWDCVEPRGDETALDDGCDCDQGGSGSGPILGLLGLFLLGYRRWIGAARGR